MIKNRRKKMKKSLLALVAGVMVLGSGVADAKTLKFQISSKSGDWAHNYLTENWKQLEVVTEGSLKMDVLPLKLWYHIAKQSML